MLFLLYVLVVRARVHFCNGTAFMLKYINFFLLKFVIYVRWFFSLCKAYMITHLIWTKSDKISSTYKKINEKTTRNYGRKKNWPHEANHNNKFRFYIVVGMDFFFPFSLSLLAPLLRV